MSVEMIAPEWMHSQITAAEYDSWTAEQCAGIEIVDGMIVVSPSASKRHGPSRAGRPYPRRGQRETEDRGRWYRH